MKFNDALLCLVLSIVDRWHEECEIFSFHLFNGCHRESKGVKIYNFFIFRRQQCSFRTSYYIEWVLKLLRRRMMEFGIYFRLDLLLLLLFSAYENEKNTPRTPLTLLHIVYDIFPCLPSSLHCRSSLSSHTFIVVYCFNSTRFKYSHEVEWDVNPLSFPGTDAQKGKQQQHERRKNWERKKYHKNEQQWALRVLKWQKGERRWKGSQKSQSSFPCQFSLFTHRDVYQQQQSS